VTDLIPQGISFREAVKLARELGIDIKEVAGEMVFSVPGRYQVRANRRKKVASRELVKLLREQHRQLEHESDR
jgi:hypothetical protein